MRPSASLALLVSTAFVLVDASAAADTPKPGDAAPKAAVASTGGK